MAIKVGINGFGRIGRNLFRAAMGDKDIEIVAVNDITSPDALAYLLKHDSVLGGLKANVSSTADGIVVDGHTVRVFKERDPGKIDWPSLPNCPFVVAMRDGRSVASQFGLTRSKSWIASS